MAIVNISAMALVFAMDAFGVSVATGMSLQPVFYRSQYFTRAWSVLAIMRRKYLDKINSAYTGRLAVNV